MEFLVEIIRVNAFDPRIWIILICIPLLLVRMVYVSIKRKNSWGISGIFYKLIPFLLLIFGGLFVFGHIMGILRAEFATIGGFLMIFCAILFYHCQIMIVFRVFTTANFQIFSF